MMGEFWPGLGGDVGRGISLWRNVLVVRDVVWFQRIQPFPKTIFGILIEKSHFWGFIMKLSWGTLYFDRGVWATYLAQIIYLVGAPKGCENMSGTSEKWPFMYMIAGAYDPCNLCDL
jgi:hypothetical protein